MTDDETKPDEAAQDGSRLDELESALARAEFVLPTPSRDRDEDERRALLRLSASFLRPRLADPGFSFVVAAFGASGVGKSTLVNSIARQRVGTPRRLRPASRRAAVLVATGASPDTVTRLTGPLPESAASAVDVTRGDSPAAGLVLVDLPPPEVLTEDGTGLAEELLALADLGLVVTSPGRYADAGAWAFTQQAAARGLPLLFVMNRLPLDPQERKMVVADYGARLDDAGLSSVAGEPVIAVAEQETRPDHGGVADIGPLRDTLISLARPDRVAEVRHGSMTAGMLSLGGRASLLARRLAGQARAAGILRDIVDTAYRPHAGRLSEAAILGSLPVRPNAEWEDALADVTRAVTRTAGAAAQDAATSWEGDTVGRQLLTGSGQSLWRHGPDTESDATERLEAWVEVVLGLATARFPRWWAARRRRRLAFGLRAAAIGLHGEAAESVSGLAGHRADALIGAARKELAAELAAVLHHDQGRFRATVGDPDALAASAHAVATGVDALTGELGS